MRRKVWFVVLIKTIVISILIFLSIIKNPLEETIQWYPIDDTISFTEVMTDLQFNSKKDEDEYSIQWSTLSKVDENITMRLDISLLFEDGLLRVL
ncbi:MAG: hypothetical protein LRY71_11825 [Bacillaceae bacterium]|nr:hypothetical protein [Bacillaceae bacterium]